MKPGPVQTELFGLFWQPREHPFRLRVNDLVRVDGRMCRVIRVTDCAAVLLMNRPRRVVVAELPHTSWSLTSADIERAIIVPA